MNIILYAENLSVYVTKVCQVLDVCLELCEANICNINLLQGLWNKNAFIVLHNVLFVDVGFSFCLVLII